MKIKSILIALMTVIGLVSCSKDGSRTIQLDEFQAIETGSEFTSIDKCKKTSEIFSIVPGEYTISWTLLDELPMMDRYAGTFTVKLKLNKKLKVKETFIKELKTHWVPDLVFTDADGKKLGKASALEWSVAMDVTNGYSESNCINKDQLMDFVKFLQSEPGTEMDIVFGTVLVESSDARFSQDVTDIKKAKGVIMYATEDEWFFRDVAEFAE